MADPNVTPRSADLVVIGAGGAGLVAAAAALEAGLRDIVILEKAPSPGGNTAQSAGMFAIGSPAQRRRGIQVDEDAIFKEKMAYAKWRIDPALTRRCIRESGRMVAWLESKGMLFENVIEFLREDQAPKVFHSFCLGPDGFIGRQIVDMLSEGCRGQGVDILCDTQALELRRDGRGRMAEVRARSPERDLSIRTQAAILATGGFGGNEKLLEKYFPGHGGVFTKGYPQMTGDGLSMAEEAGAAIDRDAVLLVTGPHHYPWSHVLTLLVRRPELLLVNKEGRRYCDETIFLDYHTEAGNALSRQPGMICYGLLDSTIKTAIESSGEIVSGMEREAGGSGAWVRDLDRELEAGVAGGTVVKADTWEEVAAGFEAAPEVLRETVERYNRSCAAGRDEEFFKEKAFLSPLRTAPFYAVLGRQGFDTTLGGVKIDHNMRVQDVRGQPIAGLYATGDCASQWEHADYNLRHPGSAMTFALCSGYIAGQEAAAYVGKTGSGG